MRGLRSIFMSTVRSQSISRSVIRSLNQFKYLSRSFAIYHPINQSINQSANQPVNQMSEKSVNQSINESVMPPIRVGVTISVIRERSVDNQSENQSVDQHSQTQNEPDYEFLLIKRGKQPMINHWALPGGSVNPGETIVDAASRELYEECGIRCEMIEPFYTTEVISINQPVSSNDQSNNQSTSHSDNQSNDRFHIQSINQSANQSLNQTTDQANNQSSAQTVSQKSTPSYHFVLVHVFCERISINHKIIAGDDALEARWFTRQQIADMQQSTTQSNNQIVPRVGEVVDRALLLYKRTYGQS
jgi:ADP-ribose pyrophosphatase YjhB (NUDIX family)